MPAALATRVAALEALEAACDVIELSAASGMAGIATANLYFDLGVQLGLDWLRASIERLAVDNRWQAAARASLRNNASRLHRQLAGAALMGSTHADPKSRAAAWLATNRTALTHWQRTLSELRAASSIDFAALAVGLDGLRQLAD